MKFNPDSFNSALVQYYVFAEDGRADLHTIVLYEPKKLLDSLSLMFSRDDIKVFSITLR